MVTEERAVEPFHGVEVRNQGNLEITFGSEASLEIEAEDNLQEHLRAEVRNGILYFETVPSGTNIRTRKQIVYHLTAVKLDRLSTSSAGSIAVPAMEVDSLVVDISSAGSVEIDSLIAHSLRASLSSAGDLRIRDGAVIDQIVSISSAGKYEARNMSSERANLSLSSAGKATVLVNEYLEADISSVGNLYYSGEAEVDINTSSMGKAIRLDD
jgi:hypothetical protein